MSRRQRRRRKPVSWSLRLALLAAGLFLLLSLMLAAADFSAFRAKAWVEAWDNQARLNAKAGRPGYRPADADWESAHEEARLAVRLAPFSGHYREVLARVYQARVMDIPDADPALAGMMDAAREQYQHAVRLQPAWPYFHTGIAYTYRRQMILDARYEQSLKEALRLGAWEPGVIEAVVSYNLDVMYRLPPSTRHIVIDALNRGLHWTQDANGQPMPYGDQLWAMIRANHRDMVVCSWLKIDTPRLRQLCIPPVPPMEPSALSEKD